MDPRAPKRGANGRFQYQGGPRKRPPKNTTGVRGGTRAGDGGIVFAVVEKSAGWEKLRRTLEAIQADRAYVKTGVIGEPAKEAHADEGGPMTNARLAAIHEFGTDTIPARPFILGTFELNRKKYLDVIKGTIFPGVIAGRVSVRTGLEVLGHMMAKDMRNRIVEGEGIPPPNAPSTIKRKLAKGKWKGKSKEQVAADMAAGKGPKPLIDTGRLRNSITHAVVIGGSEK